ncbi:transmembrane protein 214-A-like [Canna indica]|uniref:Transmembrane protein 214-A-like n=1 Tax=Canna indica TaxID=4628 RepID=A0AAQ3K816_9LILI|nr:transmembrane protein 214-A-like [Canna indica]
MEDFADAAVVDGAAPAADPNPNHGWHKVTYAKRQRKPQPRLDPVHNRIDGFSHPADRTHVFDSLEQKARERRRAIESAATAAAAAEADGARSGPAPTPSDDENDDSDAEAGRGGQENDIKAPKNEKQKQPKKPKVTVAEAAAKIDAADLAVFLADISALYESQQDIQLMRFADFFARSFGSVTASQFPWAKMFKESPVSKIADIPLCHISESVYKTSVDWIALKSPEALSDFVLWCLDSILADLASQQSAIKGSKKSVQRTPKNQVAIFVVLAIVLRRKPDTLISMLFKFKDNPQYQGQEKLPVIIWAIVQASHGDLVVGMYLWAHYLFPSVCGKSQANPQSRDLVLQLVERILSGPKARAILLNGAVRKGERLVTPAAFDLLMRMTFPAPAVMVKATERFKVVYPTLKELALAGSPGTKTTKQASQQLLAVAVLAMKEQNQELRKETTEIFIWCLIQNVECFKQWEKLHIENVDASIVVLHSLSSEWKKYSPKISLDALRVTLQNLRVKNEEALSKNMDASRLTSIKDADKCCKAVLGKLTRRFGFMKGGVFVLVLAMGIYFAVTPSLELLDWEKLQPSGSAQVLSDLSEKLGLTSF